MARTFQFLFDVGGPNGYLVHRVLPQFCAAHEAVAAYVPVLLGGLMKATGNRPPWMVYADVPAKTAYDRLEFDRFIAAHGLTRFRMNSHFPINTILLMRILTGVHGTDAFGPVLEAVLAGMWEDDRDMGDPAVVAAVLDDAGLDGAGLIAMADDPAVKAALTANTEDAVARGAFGIPTFFVGNDMFFGKERLGQVAAALG
ncbi:MAG: hypothetical protein RLZZ58_2061 [Pseudomonadota bacterium]